MWCNIVAVSLAKWAPKAWLYQEALLLLLRELTFSLEKGRRCIHEKKLVRGKKENMLERINLTLSNHKADGGKWRIMLYVLIPYIPKFISYSNDVLSLNDGLA